MPLYVASVSCTSELPSSMHWAAIATGLCLFFSSLPAGVCDDKPLAAATAPAPSVTELLTGAKTAQQEFETRFDFRLTQNTVQIDTQLNAMPEIKTFVLDSGAPMTIAPELAKEFGLPALATVGLAGPEGGHISVPVTRIPQLAIADVVFRDVGAVVDWAAPPNELACLSTAGLLGASLLQTAIWQIDFQNQRVTISRALSGLPGLEKANRLPFTRADAAGSPRISVGVGTADDVSLLIDLGFNGGIAIPAALLEKSGNRIAADAPMEEGQATSTVLGNARSTVRIAQLDELRIGELSLKDFPVMTGTAVSDFHVGIDFLRHFRVTIDWMNDTLYLERRSPESALYDRFAAYGFKPQLRDGELVVAAIWQGSDVDKAGLEIGDRIVELDGEDTSRPSFGQVCNILDALGRFGTNTAPVSLTRLRDGERKVFTAARAPLLP